MTKSRGEHQQEAILLRRATHQAATRRIWSTIKIVRRGAGLGESAATDLDWPAAVAAMHRHSSSRAPPRTPKQIAGLPDRASEPGPLSVGRRAIRRGEIRRVPGRGRASRSRSTRRPAGPARLGPGRFGGAGALRQGHRTSRRRSSGWRRWPTTRSSAGPTRPKPTTRGSRWGRRAWCAATCRRRSRSSSTSTRARSAIRSPCTWPARPIGGATWQPRKPRPTATRPPSRRASARLNN